MTAAFSSPHRPPACRPGSPGCATTHRTRNRSAAFRRSCGRGRIIRTVAASPIVPRASSCAVTLGSSASSTLGHGGTASPERGRRGRRGIGLPVIRARWRLIGGLIMGPPGTMVQKTALMYPVQRRSAADPTSNRRRQWIPFGYSPRDAARRLARPFAGAHIAAAFPDLVGDVTV